MRRAYTHLMGKSVFNLFGTEAQIHVSNPALANNGNIYASTFGDSLLKIDPINKTTTLIPVALIGTANKTAGAVRGIDGNIYLIPFNFSQILEFDPVSELSTTFGTLSGTNKYQNGVLATDDKIYAFPRDANQVLEIDTVNKTISVFGSVGTAINKYTSGDQADNNYIYCIPFRETRILKIDIVTKTTTFIGSGITTEYFGSAKADNGKFYAAPTNSGQVIEFDPITETFTYFGPTLSGYGAIVLGSDGFLYGLPNTEVKIAKIDPVNKTVELIGRTMPPNTRFTGGVKANNGNIYAAPSEGQKSLEIIL